MHGQSFQEWNIAQKWKDFSDFIRMSCAFFFIFIAKKKKKQVTAASFLGANFKFTEKISSDFFKLNTRNSDEHEKEEVQDKRWFIRSRRAVASSLVVSVQRRQGTPTHRQLSEYSLMTVFGSRLNLARFPSLFTVRNQHEIGTQGKQIKKGAVCKKWIPGRLTIGWNRPVAVHGRGHKLIFLPPTSSASRCLGIQPEQQYEPTRPGKKKFRNWNYSFFPFRKRRKC